MSQPNERDRFLSSETTFPADEPAPRGLTNVDDMAHPSRPTYGTVSNNSSANFINPEEHTEANQTLSAGRTTACTIAIGVLIFVQAVNISMLTTIQSAIADELNSSEETTWFTSVYLIAMAASSPMNGKLCGIFPPRLCIFAAALITSAGVVITGVAQDFSAFITGRIITGAGAGGILTVALIIVLELTGTKHRGLGIGLLNSGYTFGVATGAVLAGAFLPMAGWRFLFYIQAPPALVAGVVLLAAIPSDFTGGNKEVLIDSDQDSEPESTWEKLKQLDYAGALSLTAGIVLMLYSLSAPKSIPIAPLVISVIVLAAFVFNEVYLATDPILPVSLLRSRGLLLTCLATAGFMMVRWAVLFYTPTYAIAVRLWSPAAAGSMLIPTNGGFAIGGLLVGWLHIRRPGSFYLPALISSAIFPVTIFMIALCVHHDGSLVLMILSVLLCGMSTGAMLNYGLAHVLYLLPKESHYMATALLATFRGFAGSFGSAIGGGLFTRTLYDSLTQHFAERGIEGKEALIRRLLGVPALIRELDGQDREIAVLGYEEALRTMFLAGAGLALATVFVQAGVGWQKEVSRKDDEERRARDSTGQ